MDMTSTFCQSQFLHQNLARHNQARIAANCPSDNWEADERGEFEYRVLEGHYLEELRYSVKPLVPDQFQSATQFADWYENLQASLVAHPFYQWLENEASLPQMRWFLTQEFAAKPVFSDLLALTQIGLPVQTKIEIARNFWDEMSQGKQPIIHRSLLERTIRCLRLKPAIETTVWQSLAYGNAMFALANTRRYSWQSVGALGMHELIMPFEAGCIAKGLKRLGMDAWVTSYFDLHAALDVAHGRNWVKDIIKPLVINDMSCAPHLAEGALMRLLCARRCLNRYSKEFGISHQMDDEMLWQDSLFDVLKLSA